MFCASASGFYESSRGAFVEVCLGVQFRVSGVLQVSEIACQELPKRVHVRVASTGCVGWGPKAVRLTI